MMLLKRKTMGRTKIPLSWSYDLWLGSSAFLNSSSCPVRGSKSPHHLLFNGDRSRCQEHSGKLSGKGTSEDGHLELTGRALAQHTQTGV